jgi:hypothetical protein
VGKNLRDHPLVWATWRTKPDFPLDGTAPRMQVCLRYTAEDSDLRNDMKISMQSYATEVGRAQQPVRGARKATSRGLRPRPPPARTAALPRGPPAGRRRRRRARSDRGGARESRPGCRRVSPRDRSPRRARGHARPAAPAP